jgi:hypothetical protein
MDANGVIDKYVDQIRRGRFWGELHVVQPDDVVGQGYSQSCGTDEQRETRCNAMLHVRHCWR